MVDETDSTNVLAGKLPIETPEGSVVVAKFQSNGRGQAGNFWESENSMNLTCSVFLKPCFLKPIRQFYLSKTISLAVVDVLSSYIKDVYIKWPNDIYVNKKDSRHIN